jgi:DNA-binding transcriptional LysR family regulator
MDTRYLATFLSVVEAGSMAEAARRLDLAPTTVAQQIKALELDFGSRLLTRSGRTLRPTVAGTRILERTRLIVDSVRDLRSEACETALPAGPLRLGVTPTALMGLLPPVLRAWNQRYKGIEIYIEPGTSMTLLSRVAAGALDAAVVVHPSFVLPKTCDWLPLRKEQLILLAPAKLKVTDPLATVAREPFIRYDRNVVAGRLADDYLRARGIHPHVQFELDGIEHIARFVAEGLGVSILPDWPVIGPRPTDLRRWKLPSPCPSRTVGLVWLRSSVRTPLSLVIGGLLATPPASPGAPLASPFVKE